MFGQKVYITDEDMLRIYNFLEVLEHSEIDDIMDIQKES